MYPEFSDEGPSESDDPTFSAARPNPVEGSSDELYDNTPLIQAYRTEEEKGE